MTCHIKEKYPEVLLAKDLLVWAGKICILGEGLVKSCEGLLVLTAWVFKCCSLGY